jgi:hypothetical protein
MSIDLNTQTWREIKAIVENRIEALKQELWEGPITHEQAADTARRVRIDELQNLMDTLTGAPND